MILYFYLLELSNYKQNKHNKKLMKKFVHKLKRKSKNLQVNYHEISQESSTVLISHHMLGTVLHPQNTQIFFLKKSTLFLRVENKSFDSYYIIEHIR